MAAQFNGYNYNGYSPYPQMQQQRFEYSPQMQQSPQPQIQPQMKGWPVTSEEEARKAIIDLDGSVFFFPNIQTGELYSKQINTADFSPIFRVYKPVDVPAPMPQQLDASMFAKQDEVLELRNAVTALQSEIEHLTAPAKEAKK